jgi:SRSO17 transposase
MTPEQLEQIRPRLTRFAATMLGELKGYDQPAKGELYTRGLLTNGRRKSMQPMAERLGVDHQRLQRFITDSSWDYQPVRARLARWGTDTIHPDAYVIDDTGFPKDGLASPCVARQYSGTLGKRANCQVAVSVQLASDHASLGADWRLFCPESWDDTTTSDPDQAEAIHARRERAHLPDTVRHREKWRLALDMLDELTGNWGLPKLPVVSDSGYGDATEFRLGLDQRALPYVVAVDPTATAYPGDATPEQVPYTGRGRPPKLAYPMPPVTFKALALAAGRGVLHQVTWRHGSKRTKGNPTAAMRSRFLTIRIHPANRNIPRAEDGSLPAVWLIAEWPAGKPEPTDYWLSNLPTDTPLKRLVHLAKIRWRVEHDYRELKTGLGIDHFEGRSFTGWHRHVTLVGLAQAFITSLRLDPKAPAPA